MSIMITAIFGTKEQWSKVDRIWVMTFSLTVLSIALITNNGWLAMIAAIAGIVEPILSAKGKASNWIFGFITVVLYGYIALKHQIYGLAVLNLVFYAPLQIAGFFMWRRSETHNDQSDFEEVKVKTLQPIQLLYCTAITIVLTILIGLALQHFNSQMVVLNALVFAFSVIGQFLMMGRYTEQWYAWLFVNIFSIAIWSCNIYYANGDGEWNLLAMCIAKLFNSIFGIYSWKKMERSQKAYHENDENHEDNIIEEVFEEIEYGDIDIDQVKPVIYQGSYRNN